MKIRTGGPGDAADTLALLDAAVAWLASHGRTGQWGDKPWTGRPAAVERIHRYAGDYLLRAAEDTEGRTVGVCVLAEEPPDYATPAGERELYVRLLVTDRERSGSGIGAALVADAVEQARSRGIGLLRVDCYAGDDRKLVAQYERLGFTPTEAFEAAQPSGPWPGQILAIRL
ncbi:GNAT family N-acetyltransferase [Kitasatospora sp. NPDC085879]|jgi:GNAT superfamily N-acetyltransferase|uniref:GNAT family N-acetyltransferase n=1 Tax=Kitasatospora sp. NPDC085879 TaxID=3154769 RepID=UPI000BB0E336|nr:GNAT family N-acetyltransferase [Streptomyces sp. TLI_235]PBC78262.1 ribosomal protein S18 acetylase RimI-like enzyme [Streptomyces sp. TLI_235]